MSLLLEIAERCEKATGPDRSLDVDIVFALYPEIGAYQPHCAGEEPIFWNDPYRKQRCPKFTESLDAAMTLVPKGYPQAGFYGDRFYLVGNGNTWACAVEQAVGVGHWSEHWKDGMVKGCASPALAICAASLRAKSALSSPLASKQLGGE